MKYATNAKMIHQIVSILCKKVNQLDERTWFG